MMKMMKVKLCSETEMKRIVITMTLDAGILTVSG